MANNIDEVTEDILRNHYPLHSACLTGDVVRVKELLSVGCFDVFQEDGCRAWTPIHWAAYGGHWKCLALLKEFYGVGMDVLNKRINQTPAHVAALECQTECIDWLVHHGIPLGVQDYLGDTPLHKAAKLGNLSCVKLLTSYGPALSIFNHSGHTPLDVATLNGHADCKAFLEEALASQHSSFFPSSSSPILMNGEGIYQCQKTAGLALDNANDHHMDLGEEAGSRGAVAATATYRECGMKRSFDDEEESGFKKQRLHAPMFGEKTGTSTNNNVLSSYNAVLAVSAAPDKNSAAKHHLMECEQVYTMPPGQHPKPSVSYPNLWNPPEMDLNASSSFVDHCNSLHAQLGYDSVVAYSVVKAETDS